LSCRRLTGRREGATLVGMLETRELSKSFGANAVLRALDIALEPATVTAIVGPNGSGKSTLLKILWGELRPESGTVLWDGDVVDTASERWKRLVAVVPDDDALVEGLSIRGHFRLCGGLSGIPARVLEERTDILIDVFELKDAERSTRSADEASRGNRKRLALALALLGEPRIILMDEPYAGLDAERATSLTAVLRLLADRGRTVAFSCHDDGITRSAADRFLELRDGTARSGRIGDLPGAPTGAIDLAGALPWLD